MPYLFGDGTTASDLVDRLREHRWLGQIVGPHGVGKSTLLATLLPEFSAASRSVQSVALHDSQRKLPKSFAGGLTWQSSDLIVVDGFEQLSWWRRRQLIRRCRRAGCGLLVTAHGDVGLPRLISMRPSLDAVQRVVERLQSEQPVQIGSEEVREVFQQQHQDARETLFALYDLYERCNRRH